MPSKVIWMMAMLGMMASIPRSGEMKTDVESVGVPSRYLLREINLKDKLC